MSKTLWIDLTDISVWHGHHTGIQRVVYNLAKRYAANSNVRYFIFDPGSKHFRSFSFAEIERQMSPVHQASAAATRSAQLETAKTLAYRLYTKSPLWLKDKLASPKNKARLRQTYHRLHRYAHRPRISRRQKLTEPPITFGPNDTVLVLGKAWDFAPDFMEALRRAKQAHSFQLVQLVYDLMPVFYPHLFGQPLIEPYTNHLFEVVASSDRLLAISHSTKQDLIRFCKELHLPQPPIKVIRLGDDFAEVPAEQPDALTVTPGNFVLSVGTIELRKNHQLLYTTYKEALAQGITLPKLVIVGAPGWYTGDVLYQFIHDPQLKGLVYIRSDISDGGLRWLYENCRFTIYPSVYEGWGLPIAESLLYGKLCLAANTASLPEIAGDLIDYFSPYNSAECLRAITTYLDHEKLKQKEVQIIKTYKPTSWDDTLSQVSDGLSDA